MTKMKGLMNGTDSKDTRNHHGDDLRTGVILGTCRAVMKKDVHETARGEGA